MDYPLIVGGKEVFTEEKLEVCSPYDGSVVGRVSVAGDDEIEKALDCAKRSFSLTRTLTAREREQILTKARDLLAERAEDFARIITMEMGKTIAESRLEVSRGIENLALSAHLLREPVGEVIPFDSAPNGAKKWGFYKRFPLGPVLAITPFNFPLNLALHKIGPAIAAGNPFILKPASKTPITGLMLGKLIIDAGYPPEAVSVLPGPGAKVGEKLAKDERIKVVTFTGSYDVGVKLSQSVALKRVAFELGSNSAAIVLSDADLLWAADRIVKGAMALAGQVCISVQRVYAEEPIFDRLVELVVSAAKNIKLGDPIDESTTMGPMISQNDVKRISSWISEAVMQGGEVVTGGNHDGNLFEPTVLINVPQSATIVQKEAFAPVVVVNKVSDLSEAIDMVNDSIYGLQAGIFTNNINAARRAFEEIEVGGVVVNDVPTFRADIMPYGGVKGSGLGREGPRYALEHMTYIKVCVVHKPDNE